MVGSCENRAPEETGSADDFDSQQVAGGVEVEHDVTSPGSVDDDLFDGLPVPDVIGNLDVGRINFHVDRDSHTASRP